MKPNQIVEINNKKYIVGDINNCPQLYVHFKYVRQCFGQELWEFVTFGYCRCCNGKGTVNQTEYVLEYGKEGYIKYLGEKTCPGCDGKMISNRAENYRKDL